MAKTYVVTLSQDERQDLESFLRGGRRAVQKVRRAQALLKADQGVRGPGWTDQQISEAIGLTTRALQNLRKRAVQDGPEVAVQGKPRSRPSTPPKLDGEAEARLLKLACSQPPAGRSRWTLRLLAHTLVELEVVDSISHEAVRQRLKKTRFGRTVSGCGVSRPRRMRRLSPRWSRCSKSTSGRTIPGGRWCAWTSSPSS